jgi:hypothetical protein
MAGPRLSLNTADFQLNNGGRYMLEDGSGFYLLEDGSGQYLLDCYVPQLGDPITFTNPSWTGRVVSVETSDFTDLVTNYNLVTVTATNTATAPGGTAPGDLSDTPTGGFYLLEDGSGDYLLEDSSGKYVLEGTSFAYRHLSIRQSQNQDGTNSTYGSLETFEGGFQPGQTFLLTSTNQGINAFSYTISNVTTDFIGANPPTPIYTIEFGDSYLTLQQAGGGILTKLDSQASIIQGQVAPGGTYGFVELSATQGTFTALTDITGLTLTVAPPLGRRYRIETVVPLSSSVALDILAITITEGSTVLAGDQKTNPSVGGFTDLHASKVIVADGAVHTYKVQAERAAGTGNVTMQAGQTQVGVTHYAHLLIEDIGT